MVVRMRSTRSHTGNRRSHHALVGPRLSTCKDCGKLVQRHVTCANCGKYKGRVVIDVMKKMAKATKTVAPEKAEKAEKPAKKVKVKKEASAK